MNLKAIVKVLCVITCASSSAALAKDNGCLIRGTLDGNGIHQVFDYCASNNGMSEGEFKQSCRELFGAQVDDLSKSEAKRFSMTFVSRCPANHKGVCEGALGRKWKLLYMRDDYLVESGLEKLTCEALDGRWKK